MKDLKTNWNADLADLADFRGFFYKKILFNPPDSPNPRSLYSMKLFKFLLLFIFSVNIFAQEKINDVKINIFPASAKIRPLETATIQVQFFGERKKDIFDKVLKDESQKGRLQIDDWKMNAENGGWISKPFLLQTKDENGNDSRLGTGLDNLLKQGMFSVAAKDSVLFTAPEKTGKYTIKITRGEITKEVVIEVSNSAPSSKKEEFAKFPPVENSADKYLPLVENYAPFIAQETWFEPKADYLARFDYDGNWQGADNWENLDSGSSKAFVYYAVMETETHWFLIYNFFHPRDYSDFCAVGSCHENDNEGLILTVRKTGEKFGKLEVLETLAHNNVYSFTNDSSIKKGAHDIDGKVEFYKEKHPIIFIEAGGHGVFASSSRSSLFSAEKMDFKQNTGVTYVYNEKAESPKSPNDRNVGYALLPIYDEWWKKGNQETNRSNETFEKFYVYEPFGNRPRASAPFISGAFHGRTASENMAKPFWSWYDGRTRKKKLVNTGQWAIDPAYSVSINLNFPKDKPFSLDYIFNPYLKQ